jgi:hypothetical protein
MPDKTPKNRTKTTSASKKSDSKKDIVEAASPANVSTRPRTKKVREIPPEERYRMIAETAYFIAERRGFSNGRCEDDWFEAERLVMTSRKPD